MRKQQMRDQQTRVSVWVRGTATTKENTYVVKGDLEDGKVEIVPMIRAPVLAGVSRAADISAEVSAFHSVMRLYDRISLLVYVR